MQEITPNRLASLIHERLIRIDFEKPDFNRDDPAVRLTLFLKEEMPEYVFLNIRFELIVQVAESGMTQPDGTPVEAFQAIAFAVTDVLAACGSQPYYMLEIRPVKKRRALDTCHRLAFITLSDEARMYRREGGEGQRDWREDVIRVRFCHARHPDVAHECENPRANPLQIRTRLPPREAPGDDEQDVQRMLAAADDAFSDPSPGEKPAAATERAFEFDLDEALRTSAA